MQNNIKKVLVIFPTILLLCMSFIGVNAKAEVKVYKQYDIAATINQSSKSNNLDSMKVDDSKTNESKTNSTENKETGSTSSGNSTTISSSNVTDPSDTNVSKNEDSSIDKNYAATIGWKEIKGLWYYFNEAGIKQTGWQLINYNWYHLDEDGIMDTGWIKDDGNKYYLNDEGIMATDKKYIEDNWYFFRNDGVLQTGFYNNEGKYCYSNKNGIMGANQWIKTKTNKYYVKADSNIATGNAIIDGVMENFKSNGKYIGTEKMEDHLFIKYLNVGNADCAFIKLPSGETALIDTGDVKTSEKVVNFLKEQDLKQEDGKGVIDYIIITHGHSDHIGGLATILNNFQVKKVYIPDIAIMEDWYSNVKVTTESAASIEMMKIDYDIYNDAVQAMKDQNIKFTNTKKGEFIDKNKILQFVQADKNFGGVGSEKISEYYWGMNENSAIVYLNYGDLQALFTGDMQWNAEKYFWVNDLLDGRAVDVLKVPHHGKDTSSTVDYIRYLKPDIGIVSRAEESVQKNTAYNNLISNGVSVYETSTKDGVSIYATEKNWTVQK